MADVSTRQTVHLQGVPVAVARAIVTYRNEMIRELQLVELGGREPGRDSGRLHDVAGRLRADLEWLRDDFSDHIRSSDAGPEQGAVNLVVAVQPDAARRMPRALAQVEELNRLSRQGHLLTVAATPEMVDVLCWVAEELVGQLEQGRAPRPYRSSES